MTFLGILGMIATGLAIATIGVRTWRRRGRRSRAPGTPPSNGSSETPPPVNPASPVLSSMRPGASLIKLQERVVAGSSSLRAELAKAAQQRINDLIKALAEAHSVLSAGGTGALNVAAKKIVYCRWITGHGWRRYLADFGAVANVGNQIDEALAEDMGPLVNEIARLLAVQPPLALVRGEEGFGLACAACGESAVMFQLKEGEVLANSISNVYRTTYWKGETAQRLAELLAEGSARAVLDFLASPGHLGCPAYCPECGRVYCQEHYSVEETWSGSWHEASYATCPLGHEREFE